MEVPHLNSKQSVVIYTLCPTGSSPFFLPPEAMAAVLCRSTYSRNIPNVRPDLEWRKHSKLASRPVSYSTRSTYPTLG
ncbi:Uncharacterized protein HZ326_25641 [Fusarium oxysporum f. sp. albedinis]|nr:Uncharacterized protein HZ326_25641 [Fusarium oxysporum f. sp. albedinis]